VPPPQTADPLPEFRQLGFRVPAIVAGPLVRRGAVVSTPFEHVSIAATLRTRFGIASLGPRMDAAPDLSSCLEPAAASRRRRRCRSSR
jgi:phospholipase C